MSGTKKKNLPLYKKNVLSITIDNEIGFMEHEKIAEALKTKYALPLPLPHGKRESH